MEIVKLTVDDFVERVKALSFGEHFDFANGTACSGVPRKEEELSDWHGVQKLCLFDNEMCIVSKYGGPGCRAFSTDDDYLVYAVNDIFLNVLFTDFVYVTSTSVNQIPSVTLTDDNCLNISGYGGENISIPSSNVRDIMREIETRYAIEDVIGKIEDMGNTVDFSKDELRQIAEEVIDRRDDCDLICECYRQIVEETIDKF